ncbi:ribose-phosphate diphosphokinase [Elusimicrobiota bacterium]
MNGVLKIFSANSNLVLSEKICNYLNIKLSEALVDQFSDGESRIKILESVRGADCFVIQSTSPPVNQNLMELLLLIDALKRASARRITAVIPYYGYSRQDRKDSPRVPITAKLVADLLQVAGAQRILLMDIHAQQIQGFFNCPVDNLLALPVVIKYLEEQEVDSLMVVAPDTGGVDRASLLGRKIGASLALVDKRRPSPNIAKVYNVIGDVRGKNALVVDDMVDTAGTLAQISEALVKNGAKNVYAACTHGVLSGNAVEKIQQSPIKELLITDTISIPQSKIISKIKVLSVAELLGEAIRRINEEVSVGELFV